MEHRFQFVRRPRQGRQEGRLDAEGSVFEGMAADEVSQCLNSRLFEQLGGKFGSREHVHEDIKEVIKPFDWSYSTDYAGTTPSTSQGFTPSQKPIPIALL